MRFVLHDCKLCDCFSASGVFARTMGIVSDNAFVLQEARENSRFTYHSDLQSPFKGFVSCRGAEGETHKVRM